MSRKHKGRKQQQGLQHIMVRLDGGHGGLEPDCPICAMLAAQGQDVQVFDPATMDLTPERVEPMGPISMITLRGDASVARHLAESPMELPVPKGMLVGEFLLAVRFAMPALAKAFPEGALELQVDGHRLGWAAPVPPGPVTLVATARQAMS
jgi:hypothetical protein